jgi:uncharacterized protein YegP (UPF0339 family)
VSEERVETFKSEQDGQFYGRVVAANGRELIRTSEGYENEADARQALLESAHLVIDYEEQWS